MATYHSAKRVHLAIFYFANRYCTLGAIISAFILTRGNLNDCRQIFAATLCLTHLSLTLASLNLATRTIAIWLQDKVVSTILGLLILGHLCLVIIPTSSSITRVPGGCAPSTRNYSWDAAIYLYAFVFDSIVLGLNAFKLREELNTTAVLHPSTLSLLIFRQGAIYFVVACLMNFMAFIFLVLDLSHTGVSIGAIASSTTCASVCCTMVACRVVRSLSDSRVQSEWFSDAQEQPTVGSWHRPSPNVSSD
ncbi:hypothetical protein CPB83DRAFT_568526 [Crepidotus variabilis]|uniref:Uncharacterized protein n=1 Tax=Crepidotus variabilis TaxID=179855 RepID=A0A9P6EA29_9AGAR|nr:hypothetical protein CPB83DRAFT_568526 [Crepidotus variabilis]